jgi:hypothetical protein
MRRLASFRDAGDAGNCVIHRAGCRQRLAARLRTTRPLDRGGRGSLPGAFSKSSPKNNARNQSTSLTLSWAASTGSHVVRILRRYDQRQRVRRDVDQRGVTRSAAIGGLATKTAHYWQVRARNASGTTLANGGMWWKFTTR